MKRSYKKFPLEVKEKVLEASEVGRTISSISGEYGVPEQTISRWCRERKKLSSYLNQTHEVSKFVELSLNGAASSTALGRASLTFRGVSLTLEGKIKSTILIGIIKILEEAC